MLTYAVHPHHHHVVLIQEIPSLMGCSRHRGPSRLRGVPKVSGRKGLGMVSILPRDLISSRYVLTLLQGGPLYSGSSFGHGSSPLTSSGRPAVSTTRRDGGPKPSHAALLSELSLDQGQHRNSTTDRDTQPSCHSYVAHRLVCACHGTRQLLLDSSSMVSHLPQQGSLLKTSPLTVAQ